METYHLGYLTKEPRENHERVGNIIAAQWQVDLMNEILAHDKKWSVPLDIKVLFPSLK